MLRQLTFLFCAIPALAIAEEREPFFGSWGTPQQCAREPIKPGGTVLASPIEIDIDWLRQGQIWCRLTWFPVEPRGDGQFTGARAQCGEDSVQDYILGMTLADDALTVRWSFLVSNGPLGRCEQS